MKIVRDGEHSPLRFWVGDPPRLKPLAQVELAAVILRRVLLTVTTNMAFSQNFDRFTSSDLGAFSAIILDSKP